MHEIDGCTSGFLPDAPYLPEPGDLVYFWTGRGSYGFADLREIRDGYILDPHRSAHRGADYWPATQQRDAY